MQASWMEISQNLNSFMTTSTWRIHLYPVGLNLAKNGMTLFGTFIQCANVGARTINANHATQ
jgi:hypothetical protein